jgi:F-type H+-transporting ATPase subunit a
MVVPISRDFLGLYMELAPATIFHIGAFPVTNSFLNTLVVDALLVAAVIAVNKNLSMVPNMFQTLTEMLMDTVYNLTESVAESRAPQIFPYFMTFFLFILIANWTGLLPFIRMIEVPTSHGEFAHLFRAASTDLNVTLALALISIVATHSMSIRTLGIKEYISRYLSFNPFNLFIGLLELFSEFAKIISFSFRLFGNIFVGEVMLGQLSTFMAFILPVPLIMYELGVGVIQAVIFGMLTMAFMAILTTPHNIEGH